MLARTLLAIVVTTLAALLFYSAALLAAGLVALGSTRATRSRAARRGHADVVAPDDGAVTVLVPSHHEGEALVDTVRTLLDQDHEGRLSVWLLVKDASDASVAALARVWPGPWAEGATSQQGDAGRRVVLAGERREVVLVECGVAPKREKINAALDAVRSRYVAFLDADHRAAPDFVSSALRRMKATGARVVQSRRRPLSTLRIVQIWDSAQNHVGNEALNHALTELGHTVFFTGTTAVFDAAVLASRRLGDSITEDTFLSHDLIGDGEPIAYDASSGSYEEVAPTLASFVARRRRWAAGHTLSFFHHLRRLLARRARAHDGALRGGGVELRARGLVLALHGCFYLVPALVLVVLWAQAIHVFVQLATTSLLVCVGMTILVAAALASAVAPKDERGGRKRARKPGDGLVALAWSAPFSAFAFVHLYKWAGAEGYYAVLSFPHASRLAPWMIGALAAPLASLLLALPAVGGLGGARLVVLVVTYPLMLFVDLYAVLLGLSDVFRRRLEWTKITRENVVAVGALPAAMQQRLTTASVGVARFRRLLWLPALAAFVILANDALSPSECGETRPFLWKPLLFRRSHDVELRVTIDKARRGEDTLEVTIGASVRAPPGAKLSIAWLLDGTRAQSPEPPGTELRHVVSLPLGWERHEAGVELTGPGFVCRQTRAFSTEVKEIVGRSLLVNGEPFLVKGVIPSFANRQVALSYAEGLAQIKAIGANAIRVYHQPGREVLDAARKEQLLVLDQPERSTWEDLKVTSTSERARLVDRYRALVEETEGFPYLLMDNLGNELEIMDDAEASATAMTALVRDARARGARFPLSYSSYLTYVDYAVDVLGVNMLDTGSTYWVKAIELLRARDKPFYATELGGFVAFHERPDTELRVSRLHEQWARLERAGALGAFFFQSHDNWAQPVPPGEMNDPLSPDQPDDVRGFWDERNRPKPELAALTRIFADVTVRTAEPTLASDASSDGVELLIANRRPYALRGVVMRVDGSPRPIGDLAPGQERRVRADLAQDRAELVFEYTTHHGLAGLSRVALLLPRAGAAPVVLDPDFVEEARAPDRLTGHLVDGASIAVVLPRDWPRARVNGVVHERPGSGLLEVPASKAHRSVDELQVSARGGPWSAWRPGIASGGRWSMRFRLPPAPPGAASTPGAPPRDALLLRGAGARQVRVTIHGRAREIDTHSYRDNVLSYASLGAGPGDEVLVELDRDEVLYLPAALSPTKAKIAVDLDAPIVFTPPPVDVSRAE